jgi:hypothetical protein
LELHSRSFPKPIKRIESLCPLRFRMLLGKDEYELEVLRYKGESDILLG